MDKFDINILCELQKNGRISNLELANAVGLSPSPCSRRVKNLEDEGIIEQYACRLNAKKINLNLMALINISMDRHTPERFENFESIVKELEEVQECYLITGQAADYVIKVAVTDMEAYQQFLLGKLTRIEGVTGVHSSFVMRKVIDRTALPLVQLRS
jgi:Lrp/AsnC family leucine-responsive transcriptional regulator